MIKQRTLSLFWMFVIPAQIFPQRSIPRYLLALGSSSRYCTWSQVPPQQPQFPKLNSPWCSFPSRASHPPGHSHLKSRTHLWPYPLSHHLQPKNQEILQNLLPNFFSNIFPFSTENCQKCWSDHVATFLLSILNSFKIKTHILSLACKALHNRIMIFLSGRCHAFPFCCLISSHTALLLHHQQSQFLLLPLYKVLPEHGVLLCISYPTSLANFPSSF